MTFPTPAAKLRGKLTDKVVTRALRATLLRKDSREARVTLAFLALICRATESTYDDNPFRAAGLAMKREVWLEIQNRLGLTEDDIRELQLQVASWGE